MGGDDYYHFYLGSGPWGLHRNWRRLLGYDLRRWVWLDPLTGCWEYGRSKKVAREMLQRAYDTTPPTGTLSADLDHVWNGNEWISLQE